MDVSKGGLEGVSREPFGARETIKNAAAAGNAMDTCAMGRRGDVRLGRTKCVQPAVEEGSWCGQE